MSDANPPGGYTPPPPVGGYGAGTPGATPPPNNLVWAILATIFCCWPLGIPAIIFSTQVNSKWTAGDIAGAEEAAEKARKFSLWATIAGAVALGLIAIFYVIVLVMAGTATTTSGY